MVEAVDIEEFKEMKKTIPLIDVRSAAEFDHAHVPGSVNIALFSDEERARIGWTYKHEGQDAATVLGESFAIPRIPQYLKQVESVSAQKQFIVLCARGGLRSQSFAQLLDEAGFRVFRLEGGYKSYRRSILESYNRELSLIVLSGKTGCGKTEILKKLEKSGEQVLDLEAIACHRGSAFGSIGMTTQPSNEYFENCLSEEISQLNMNQRIWVEDESLNIGKVLLPAVLYDRMSRASQVLVEMDRSIRIDRLCREYGQMGLIPLQMGLEKIKKRLGMEDYGRALKALEKNNLNETASIVLRYYDKCYDYSLSKKSRESLGYIRITEDDTNTAAEDILKLL